MDFTLFYNDRAKEEFIKKIKEEPRSNNYVEVNYYVDFSRIKTWKYLTMEEYLNLPQTWKEFKKLVE